MNLTIVNRTFNALAGNPANVTHAADKVRSHYDRENNEVIATITSLNYELKFVRGVGSPDGVWYLNGAGGVSASRAAKEMVPRNPIKALLLTNKLRWIERNTLSIARGASHSWSRNVTFSIV